jgi:prepilin peptidase CpaA
MALGAAVAASAAAVATDIRWRRIPNAVTVTTAIAGLVLAASGLSGLSIGRAAAGFLVGLLLMLPGHIFGRMGAGDVKLFAAVGTILGPGRILAAFFYMAIAGGVLAVAFAWRAGRLRRTLGTTGRLLTQPAASRREIESPQAGNRFPYGPAIAAGTILAALGL